jgi:ABC-type transport system substrate-binding protein
MKLIVRLILLAGLVALAVWAWGFFFPAPQKIIEKHLVKLARLASFSSTDGNIQRLADAERIGSLLAENIHVVIDTPGYGSHTFDNREELLQAMMAARPALKELQAQFTDIGIIVNANQQSAVALLTAKAKIGAEPDWVFQGLRFTFNKTNGDWLITGLETVKPLR